MADIDIKVGADTREADAALGKVLNTLKQFGSIVIGGNIARELADLTIEASTLTNKLLSVSDSVGEANDKFGILANTARNTSSDIGGTVDLFQKLSQSSVFTGSSTEALAKVVERFNMTVQISGANSQGAASALYNFSQAMQNGTLMGNDFRAMSENNGFFLKVLQQQLGKSATELRMMSEQGKLSAETIAKALLESELIVDKYGNTVMTIPRAVKNLQTSMMESLKTIDDYTGATQIIANNLGGIAVAAVLALGAAFVFLDIAAAPWIAIAIAVVAGVVAIGVAFQKLYDAIKSTISLWDQFLALLDNTAAKIAKWLGIQYEISKATEETNKILDDEVKKRKQADQVATDGLVTHHQRNKAALELDKTLSDQILTMTAAAKIDGQINNDNRIGLEIEKAIAVEKAKYVKTGESMLASDIQRLSAAVQLREEAKLAANGQTLILNNQDQYSGLLEKNKQQQREINAAIQFGADTTKARIAQERLLLEGMAQYLAIQKSNPGTSLFRRYDAEVDELITKIKLADQEGAAMFERFHSGGNQNPNTPLIFGNDQKGAPGLNMGQAQNQNPLYGQDNYSNLLNGYTSFNLEVIRLDQELYAKKLGIAEQYYATILQLDKDALGNQRFGAETAKQIASDRTAFEKKSDTEKTAWALDQMAQTFTAMGQHNRQAFEAAKAFNIANAVMNTYLGATKALATYPPPFSFIGAAAAIAMGLAQVAVISSQSYSGRSLGGPVMGNTPYMVGENGPELFTPHTSGGITRNQDLSGGPTNVNFTIQAVDARGVDSLLMERKGMIVSMIRSAINDRGQRAPL